MTTTLNDLREAAENIRSSCERLRERLEAVERELSGQLYRAESDGGAAAATVDWRAGLVAVDIGTALTRTRGTDLASQVVQAVNRARAEANAELVRAMRATA